MEHTCNICKNIFNLDPGVQHCPFCSNPIVGATPSPGPQQQAIPISPQSQRPRMLPAPVQQHIRGRKPRSFRPFHKIRCPFCRWKFHPSDCAIFSVANNKVYEEAPQGLARVLQRLWIKPLYGEKYTRERALRRCPGCKKNLPYFFEFRESVNIAIVGDTSSGKSHYIAALLDQLSNGGMMQKGTSYIYFAAQNSDTETMFKEYNMFLRGQSRIPPTPVFQEPTPEKSAIRKPLIYQLIVRNTIAEQFPNSVNLIFYDIAGEEIADQDKLQRLGWPILDAHAIIYLADPLCIPYVRDNLPPDLQLSPSHPIITQRRNTHEVLDKMIQIFQQFRGLASGERIDIPTAIMLSKSDLLDEIIPPSDYRNFRLLQQIQYNGMLDERDIAAIDREVRYLLDKFGEQELLHQDKLFSTLSYFATSATGCSADDQGHFEKIAPRRCLDPFLWILWKLGTGVVSSN